MAIAESDQTTLNPGSANIPKNPGELAVQRKRFEIGADTTYAAFPVSMDELMVVEAAEASIEHALDAGTPANNYRAQVEAIEGNIVTVGVQVVSTGAELAGDVDLEGFVFVVTGEGY